MTPPSVLVKGGLHVRPTHDNHPLSPVVTAPKVIQQFSREFGKRYRSQQTSSGKSASRLRSQVTTCYLRGKSNHDQMRVLWCVNIGGGLSRISIIMPPRNTTILHCCTDVCVGSRFVCMCKLCLSCPCSLYHSITMQYLC